MKEVQKKESHVDTVLAGADDPVMEIGEREEVDNDLKQDATFVAIMNKGTKDEKALDLFRITIKPTKEVLGRKGLTGLPGTAVIVRFDAGRAVVRSQWIVDEIMKSEDWLSKIHPNPQDPSGYWRKQGIMEEVVEEVKTMELTGAAVVRGPRTVVNSEV